MSKIKIKSNPYEKSISYEIYDETENQWKEITGRAHPLMRLDLTSTFLPYKADAILSAIIEAYATQDEGLQIYFAGTEDEYSELSQLMELKKLTVPVELVKDEEVLNNARDILPRINQEFKTIYPLVQRTIRQRQDVIEEHLLSRLCDAASDVVPIVILGNYSSGKSTFINALIGQEVLPSGTDPVTARVYKVYKSRYPDRGYMRFVYHGETIILYLTKHDSVLFSSKYENDITRLLNKEIVEQEGLSLIQRMNLAIRLINDFKDSPEQGQDLSQIIEVEVPFKNGVLSAMDFPFVIIDTPGSNSATYESHRQILEENMRSMTNGLPVFILTPDNLDTQDNKQLADLIRDTEMLDDRFTTLVINKADIGDLSMEGLEAGQGKFPASDVIRKAYAGDIFYVSSILGLGAKNGGEFINDNTRRVFDQKEKYYKQSEIDETISLYQFNVHPTQNRQSALEEGLGQENELYANSGLYSVERAIEKFAGTYSPYNKCSQSRIFLDQLTEAAVHNIEQEIESCITTRQDVQDKLDAQVRELEARLQTKKAETQIQCDADCEESLQDTVTISEEPFSEEALKDEEDRITRKREEEIGYDSFEEDLKNNREKLKMGIMGISGMVRGVTDGGAPNNSLDELVNSIGEYRQSRTRKKEKRQEVDTETANQIIEKVKKDFIEVRSQSLLQYMEASIQYWKQKTEALREELLSIIKKDSALDDDQQKKLRDLTLDYSPLEFEDTRLDKIFDKSQFESKFRFFNQQVLFSNHLKLDKLSDTALSTLYESVEQGREEISARHKERAYAWMDDLLTILSENMVDFSPELARRDKTIKELNGKIEEHKQSIETLRTTLENVNSFMSWQPQA